LEFEAKPMSVTDQTAHIVEVKVSC